MRRAGGYHPPAQRPSPHTRPFMKILPRLLLFAGLAVSGLAHAERLPVLKQIDLPHPYYFREMYLPQLTAGPSSLAWSPDSGELIYSMAGSLWRQQVPGEQ